MEFVERCCFIAVISNAITLSESRMVFETIHNFEVVFGVRGLLRKILC